MSILESILGAGSAVGGGMLVKDAYDKLGQIGMQASRGADEIALESLEQTAFNPYSVQTATGANFGVGPSGSVSMAVSPQEQAIQDAALSGAQGMLSQATMDTGAREQSVYDRIRALQAEDEQRQALDLENRLFAQGRLGTSSDLYGGATPEMLAMQSANARARNEAALQAMNQAQAQQQQQAQLANAFLGMGYVPQAQLQGAAGLGYNNAALAQQGQLAGADLYGQARMGGLEAQLGAGQGQANLAGNIGSSLLSGSLSNAGGEDGWLRALGSLFD